MDHLAGEANPWAFIWSANWQQTTRMFYYGRNISIITTQQSQKHHERQDGDKPFSILVVSEISWWYFEDKNVSH